MTGPAIVRRVDGVRVGVIVLAGEVDFASKGQLRTLVSDLLAVPLEAIVVDVARLEFIDATGINALVSLSRRARERRIPVALAAPSRMLDRLLLLLGLSDLFVRMPTVTEAAAGAARRADAPATARPLDRHC